MDLAYALYITRDNMGSFCSCFRSEPKPGPPDHPKLQIIPHPHAEHPHDDQVSAPFPPPPPPSSGDDVPKSVKDNLDPADQGLDDNEAHEKSANHNHHDQPADHHHDQDRDDQKKSPVAKDDRVITSREVAKRYKGSVLVTDYGVNQRPW